MSTTSEDSDCGLPSPFLVHLAYRNGTFNRPEELTPNRMPPHVSFYTWPSCTVSELAMELAASRPSALPYPAVGTRLAFQLVYHDMRGSSSSHNSIPRYAVKDLGSIVIGHGGPGAEAPDSGDSADASIDDHNVGRTLGEARFVVGDYLSCAILPPLPDGSVAPADSLRRDVNFGMRDTRGHRGRRDSGLERSGGRDGRGGQWDSGRGSASVPAGDWRRGEALPDVPAPRIRDRGGRW